MGSYSVCVHKKTEVIEKIDCESERECICVCVCLRESCIDFKKAVYVCVKRERQREREKERDRVVYNFKKTESECVVC